ncbi:MAG: EAL domain-containing protein, partial [Gammaproteobacteria bacterium]
GTMMENTDSAVATLHMLKELGLHLAIDDFGTGYASLSYLKRFPLDRLKIDRSFVQDIITNTDDAAIARAIIAMAHSLNLKVIAEGVETEEQLSYLRAHGCDEIQGYYFSRPLPPEEVEEFLRSGKRLETAKAALTE